MPRHRPLTLLLLLGACLAGPAAAEPWRPADEGVVLLRLPATGTARDPALARLQTAAEDQPEALQPALALAEHYVAIGRASQDSRFMGYAQAALARWWDLPDPPVAVRVMRADVFQHRHRFAEALAELRAVLAEDPDNPRAWLARAAVQAVTGQPQAAYGSCVRLEPLVPRLATATCAGGVLALVGEAKAGRMMIEQALAEAGVRAAALRPWALATMGEVAAGQGDASAARGYFRAALVEAPDDVWTANALADVLLRSGEAKAAAEVITEPMTANDGALLRLALAKAAMGEPVDGLAATLEARFAAVRARGDGIAGREEARFRLELRNDPERALALALENWTTQREVEDARLVLASALAAGRPEAAEPVLAWIEETGIEDARLTPLTTRLADGG